MNEQHPYSWIKKIDSALLEVATPPLATPFTFDWENFSLVLAQALEMDNLKITTGEGEWRKSEEIAEGLSENPLYLCFTFAPLKGNIFWIMSGEDVKKITSFLLIKKGRSKGFISELLQEGFLRYMALETLNVLQDLEFFKEFSPNLVEMATPFEGPALTFDVKITLNRKAAWGRIVIPPPFKNSWNEYFAKMLEKTSLERNPALELILKLECGEVSLDLEKWEKLIPGDFVLLDKGNFDQDFKKGSALITLGNTPLFHVRLKSNKLKILDYALYYEEEVNMQENEENIPPSEEEFTTTEQIEESATEKLEEIEEATSSLKKMPITLTIEVSRFKITLEKLLKLQPGTILELPTSPEKGVKLTVNGRVVGKGELLYLGESLGVKISEIEH